MITVTSLAELITLCHDRLERMLALYLENIPAAELKSAMRYTMANGGKRLRPLLIYAAGHAFNAAWENLDIPACSVELIHTYSLIHDDLPCMDDAPLRRGKPTCHKAYNDAIAVLTGDALHTLAMQILASHPATLKPPQRLAMIQTLSIACGPYGMAAGQALDISMLQDTSLSNALLEEIYHLKTGALFSACLELGRLAANNNDDIDQRAMKIFGDLIGLAFQIQDDILDQEASSEQLGKQQGIDLINNKMTYPRLHGVTASKERVQSLYLEALEAINYLGNRAQLLRELAKMMLVRQM
jgi:farnesyl diphosphate synthase